MTNSEALNDMNKLYLISVLRKNKIAIISEQQLIFAFFTKLSFFFINNKQEIYIFEKICTFVLEIRNSCLEKKSKTVTLSNTLR
jgi:hypothetical protein